MKTYDLTIIGGGPAGMYAFYYAKHKGLRPCLLEASKQLGGQPSSLFSFKTVKDYPGFSNIKANDLIQMFINQVQNDSNIYLDCKATSIRKDSNGYVINCNGIDLIESKYIILATGLGTINFNRIENDSYKNIHYVVKSLKLYQDKKVFILGGGDSAIDWANEFVHENITNHLNIVHRRDQFRASGENVHNILNSKHVKVYFNSTVEIINDHKLSIKNNDGSNVEHHYDYVIVQYGQKIDNSISSIIEDIKLTANNKVIVDYVGKSNIENIFAIGDGSYMENKPNLISIATTDAIKTINHIIKIEKKYE